jgi:hypothetical protein
MNRRNRLRLDWRRSDGLHRDRLRLNRRQLLSASSVTPVTRFMASPSFFFFYQRLRPSVN